VHWGSAHLIRGELDSLVQIDARVKRRLRVCVCVEWRKSVTVSCSARQTTAISKTQSWMGAQVMGDQTATVFVVQGTRRVRNIDARYSLCNTCTKRDEHRARASQLRRGTEREDAMSAHRCLLVQVEPQRPFLKLLLGSERLRLREAKITWVRLMLHIVVGCGRNTAEGVVCSNTAVCVLQSAHVWWVGGRSGSYSSSHAISLPHTK
jgi:hypothetical protein